MEERYRAAHSGRRVDRSCWPGLDAQDLDDAIGRVPRHGLRRL